jgi:hypothetical protein
MRAFTPAAVRDLRLVVLVATATTACAHEPTGPRPSATGEKAAPTVSGRQLDSPEQRPEDAIDRAIAMLTARQYRAMLERFIVPVELSEMKRSDRFEQTVAKFESGWGDALLQKLKLARTDLPTLKKDGSIVFRIPGTQGSLTHPITMVQIDGRWYFRR